MTLHTALPLILIFVAVGVFVGLMNILEVKTGQYVGERSSCGSGGSVTSNASFG